MAYSVDELREKLISMYPEIGTSNLSVSLEWDESKSAWVVTFGKAGKERHAFLDRKDADECMEGKSCIYLGVLIAQYIKDLEN